MDLMNQASWGKQGKPQWESHLKSNRTKCLWIYCQEQLCLGGSGSPQVLFTLCPFNIQECLHSPWWANPDPPHPGPWRAAQRQLCPMSTTAPTLRKGRSYASTLFFQDVPCSFIPFQPTSPYLWGAGGRAGNSGAHPSQSLFWDDH